MANDFWQKVDEIFPQVADLPGDEREARLGKLCGNDENLRREISALLKGDEKAERFIESPIVLPESLSRVFTEAVTKNHTAGKFEGRKIGAYQILRKIGAGGMGAVYLGKRADGEFEKTVAVKIIRNGADTDFNLSRFRRERQILAALEHPNIARLLDGGTLPDGLPYLVMEYVEGENLLEFLRGQKANLAQSLKIFRQILSAVGYAHSKGLIHRDLKPGNILVNRNGDIRLLDFGIAKILDAEFIEDKHPETATFMRQLTPEYASPEQIKGEAITPASDVYALGVILYEILTGRRAYRFASRASHDIARVICEEKIHAPKLKFETANHADLQYIVLKSLQKNPADRYASIQDFDADIERFLNDLPVLTESERLRFFESAKENANAENVSLAIAPFRVAPAENASDDAAENSQDFLGIGLADALTTSLSNIGQIRMRPTSSVLRLSTEGKSALALGRELEADYVLEGSIARSGKQIRVNIQLLETTGGTIFRAAQFDETEQEVFRLQDAICARVVELLLPHLTVREQRYFDGSGTNSAAAYEAYLRGRVSYHAYTFTGIAASGNYFERAIEHDPNFALAHSGLADFYNWQTIAGFVSNREGFTKAKQAARTAIEIDPQLSEAYASLAFATWAYDWDFDEAERLFLKAIRLSPNNLKAREWYSYLLSSDARHDEAIEEMRRAEQLDSHSPSVATMFGFCFFNARRYAEGLAKTRRALELAPDYYLALQGLGWVCPPLGLFDEAIEGCRRAVSISNEMGFNNFSLALALIAAGEADEARQIAVEIEREKSRNTNVPAYFLAVIYANLNEFDATFEWLDKAIEERGYWTLWLRVEPRLDALREDARFAERLAKIKPLDKVKITGNLDAPTTGKISYSTVRFKTKSAAMWATAALIVLIFSFVVFKSFQKMKTPAASNLDGKYDAQSADFQKNEPSAKNLPAVEPALSIDAAANDFYRAGRQQLAMRTAEGTEKAKDFFSEALKRAPNFALAFAGLADAHIVAGNLTNSAAEYQRAEAIAVKALALDPDLAEARISLGMARFKNTGDFAAAEKHFLRAIEIDPKSATAHHWYAVVLSASDKPAEALREMEIAAQLEPDSAVIQYGLGEMYRDFRRFDEAIAAFDKSIEASNGYIPAYLSKSLIQQSRGDYDAALETYRAARIYNGRDENEPLWLIMQAQAFASHGKKAEAEKFLNRYFQTADYKKNPLAHALDVALVYNLLNDLPNTLQWLKKAAQTSEAEFMKTDLRFDNLRENPLFSPLLEK